MTAETYDIVVVGGGTAGCFAAARAAKEGLDVAVLERKTEEEGGRIACGDAIKGTSTFPDVIDLDYLKEESFTNQGITLARFENPKTGNDLDIGFRGGNGAIVDRKRYGEVLLEEADRLGAEIHYDTVVRDVVQNGAVTGVTATSKGSVREYEADVVIDAAGALSLLQDKGDFGDATFDTNVNYQQFCSAYREVIEVEEPVDWHNAIVFKPTAELGYLWYFPRTPTEINVGLGFQMNKPPMKLVEELKKDLRNREEFQGATVKDKLGAALPTRRPYDSAVAPGYMAVGDAAGHVNPCTGGGIPGAAKAGTWAAEAAMDAIADGTVQEDALWEYNRRVQTDFGKRFAAMDLYNIWGSNYDVDDLVDIVSAMPGQQLADALALEGTASMNWPLKIKTAVKTFGHWGTLFELKKLNELATDLKSVYDDYPTTPDEFQDWRARRDDLMDDVYDLTGADPKY
ncbi:geranylgeranyl reductase family protein [Natronomonas salina]|uniref:geranylgeranyl reductase family protein n=1 Tax=Natronomonas salina TaxID=1710540 RepID=UPI0015B68D4E|nr:geranylgeranyl reductase family protein [Natronomonas salina]QLD88509.1 geranylgeranyl reductase family protein [Natronomonas salina]